MIYLNEEDVLKCIDFDELMDSIEEAYKIYESKKFNMPDRIHIDNNDLTALYMPCFLENTFGTKILTVAPNNTKLNKPVIDGVMVVNDIETGEIVCIIDGKILTAVRTGAVGGVGVRHTTSEDITSVGLIGTGVQGFYQILYACKARDIKDVYLYNRTKEKALILKEQLEKNLENINIHIVDSSKELVKKSELIITATTSNTPVIDNDKELLKGKHIVAIGSYKPTMRELPDALFEILDKITVDTEFGKIESGDLSVPIEKNLINDEDITSMGEFLANKNKFEAKGKTTLYKSVGMALFDMVIASKIYQSAVEKNIGQNINL